MKIRTCPHCGYKYTLTDHTKEYFKLGEEAFVCKNCDTALSYNKKRWKIINVVPIVGGMFSAYFIKELYSDSFGVWILSYLFFSFFFYYIATTFINYRLVNFVTKQKNK